MLLLVRKKSTKGSSKEDQYKNCFICQSQTDITPTNSTDEIFNITEVADVVDKQIKIINLCGKCYKLCDIIVKSKKELKEQIKNVSTRSKARRLEYPIKISNSIIKFLVEKILKSDLFLFLYQVPQKLDQNSQK